ncbi:MAG: hypothetical protein ACLR3C_08750 [Eggerthella lenta]
MRYFPALKDEMAHIRDAMRLRDIPLPSGWNASWCRSSCRPPPRPTSCRAPRPAGASRTRCALPTPSGCACAADWAVLAASAAAVVVVALWGGAY